MTKAHIFKKNLRNQKETRFIYVILSQKVRLNKEIAGIAFIVQSLLFSLNLDWVSTSQTDLSIKSYDRVLGW